ncbi:MAG: glycine cleavage T C-terminal barrel domain-containing protein [Acidimicrobiales bacterium]
MDFDDYWALRREAGVVELARDFLRVHGPDAVSFLQGQLSQDVAALAVGVSAESLLLQPQGKVDALLRVTRTAHDQVVLDVDAGYGEAVASRLGRFKIRVKAEIEPLAWRCLAVRGPGAPDVAVIAGMVVRADWPGLRGFDLIGEAPAVDEGARRCGVEALDALRIEAGLPAMGAELTERTIPAEAGVVERTASFTKGCYTGQELVARIDSRGGKVPRRLRGVVVPGGVDAQGALSVGDALMVGDREVGRVTSVARSPSLDAVVGLAYVHRDVEPPAEVAREGDGSAVQVRSLPLVG